MEPFEEPPSEEKDQIGYDRYVGVKVRKNMDGKDSFGVKGRKRRLDGQLVGHYHANPILDTSIYEIKWHDGEVETYRANEVIEAMLMNVDDERNSILHVKEFVDPKRDASAVQPDDGYVELRGKRVLRRTTKGWSICAEIQGGETEWMDLKTAKEAYPIKLAEYAVANKLVS